MLTRAGFPIAALVVALVEGSLASAAAPVDSESGAVATDDVAVTKKAEGHRKKKKKHKRKKKHAHKKKHRRKKKRRSRPSATIARFGAWTLGVDGDAFSKNGAFSGYRTLPDGAVFYGVGGRVRPELARKGWRLRAPLAIESRRAEGLELDETRTSADGEVRYRFGPRLRISGEGRVAAVWRPDWPDQYQPLSGDTLGTTDRYSHWDRRVGVEVAGIPIRHHHSRARYRYGQYDYREDPNYDVTLSATHLVPRDYGQQELDLSWRYFGKRWKLGAHADSFIRDYYFRFSRDAKTGRTHAGPGGPPPNPLQTFRGVEPGIDGEIHLPIAKIEIDLSYGVELVQDVFQGYYSYVGHHPELKVAAQLGRAVAATARVDVRWRRYGDNSYEEGPGHPPLVDGDRRYDHRARVGLDLHWKFTKKWTAMLESSGYFRRTNFPSYEPGIFPANREYVVDWNYDNVTVSLGAQVKL